MLRGCCTRGGIQSTTLKVLRRRNKTTAVVQQLRPLVEEESESGVSVTLADNPSIIVCHHPPNKVAFNLTRPITAPSPVTEHHLTEEQSVVALRLMSEEPLIWDPPAIAELFNVSLNSVEELQVDKKVVDKRRISAAVLESWSQEDQAAFRSLISNSRYETRNSLLAQDSALFQFCKFNRAEELAKIQLYGLNHEFPDS